MLRSVLAVCLCTVTFLTNIVAQQKPRGLDALASDHVHEILHDTYLAVRKDYYDPAFHGVDIDARYRKYDEQLKQAASLDQAFRLIAAFLGEFHDSHLFFIPPSRTIQYDSGYGMQMVGEDCFITRVRPRSDAEARLHPGDQVMGFNGFAVNRGDIEEVEYFFHGLAPGPTENLDLRAPTGELRKEAVKSAVHQVKREVDLTGINSFDLYTLFRDEESADARLHERIVESEKAMYWKMAEFVADEETLDTVFSKARNHPALILDLRGNPGGSVETLRNVVGHLFDHDVKIADRVGRKVQKGHEAEVGKAVRKPYTGKLIVLVDSNSGSSAELLARVVQLEHRGTVVGDLTAGGVMEAQHEGLSSGVNSKVFYLLSVTSANLVMADGKSLEGVGVTPDERVLPTAADLAAGRDPAMARAAELAGVQLDPLQASKMFPYEWGKF